MSEVISLAAARKASPPKMRIGLLRLTDSAPVIAAYEFGFSSTKASMPSRLLSPLGPISRTSLPTVSSMLP